MHSEKHLEKKLLNETEIITLLSEIEAVIKSRPLTQVQNDL